MMPYRVVEETLGPVVASLLGGLLGCEVVQQGRLPGQRQFDITLFVSGQRIIVELEIGGSPKLLEGLTQADEYRDRSGASGVIVLVYPEEARRELTRPEDLRELALGLKVSSIVLCPFLREYYEETTLTEFASQLKAAMVAPKPAPSTALVVQSLRQAVQVIALELRRHAGIDSPVIKETVGSFDLFRILAESGDKQSSKEDYIAVVSDLASYILVNQLVLYHVLIEPLDLPEVGSLNAPMELEGYFKRVTDINYKAVFCVDVAATIPSACTLQVNRVLRAIKALNIAGVRHDLLGRVLHEFLPPDTRKLLGAFYTRPEAAAFLATLAIDDRDDKVIDPACGSGTLLVAAYQRKASIGFVRSHKIMVEREITGIDIMPFAAHLAALNLTMQSPTDITNQTRVGVGNSLALAPGEIVGTVGRWLREFHGEVVGIETKGGSANEAFKLQKVDAVVMNPPFTKKEKLAPHMRAPGFEYLGSQNYWAYFVAHSDTILSRGGADSGSPATRLLPWRIQQGTAPILV